MKSEAASSADTAGTSDEAPPLSVKREPPDSEDNRLSDVSIPHPKWSSIIIAILSNPKSTDPKSFHKSIKGLRMKPSR